MEQKVQKRRGQHHDDPGCEEHDPLRGVGGVRLLAVGVLVLRHLGRHQHQVQEAEPEQRGAEGGQAEAAPPEQQTQAQEAAAQRHQEQQHVVLG